MQKKRFIPMEEHWNNFVSRFQDIAEVVNQLMFDMNDMKCASDQARKLIKLASCQSSPINERLNACRAAFIILVKHANKMIASA